LNQQPLLCRKHEDAEKGGGKRSLNGEEWLVAKKSTSSTLNGAKKTFGTGGILLGLDPSRVGKKIRKELGKEVILENRCQNS